MQVATGSLESVRPMGVELLDTILDKVSVVFGTPQIFTYIVISLHFC